MRRFCPAALVLVLLASSPHAAAQFFSFGRNKVQYTAFDWHVLRTEHFDIYYYPEMQDLAARGARFAEEAYAELEVRFAHALADRVPLIFYSSHLHFQQTNTIGGFIPEGVGGFFEFLKGRVVIPADGSTAQFRHVIRHELVHVFMQNRIARVLADHRRTADRLPPLWFTEGLAEYWSTDWDTQAEMVMRDAVLSGTMVGLADMDRIYGSYLMYKAGQNALRYIGRVYGEEKILMLLEGFWRTSSFSELLELTIGKTYEEFDEEWLYALRKEYYPLLAGADAPSSITVHVTREGFNAKPVVFERGDLRDVYFIGNQTGYTGIYRKSLTDAAPDDPPERVLQGERSDRFEAFHPFRTKMDVSPGGMLAFVTKSGETDVLHLFSVDRREVTATLRFPDIVAIGSTTWAADGRRLVFSAIDRSGNNDLYLLTVETGDLRRLTADAYDDRDPAWAPGGERVAFSSDRNPFGLSGAYNLYLLDLATGGIEQITGGQERHLAPAWSHDGARLAFTADAGGAQNIWVMRPDARDSAGRREMRRVTRFTTAAFDPAWTAEGDLVFATFEKFSFQIRRLEEIAAAFDTTGARRTVDLAGLTDPWEPGTMTPATALRTERYEGEYSLDIAQGAIATDPVFGTGGGAFASLSDLLGDDQYYFLLYNTAESQSELLSSFNFAISHLSLGQRTNYAYGIYRFSGRRYDLTDRDEFFYERVFGGYAALSYPLSKFQRIETSMSLSNSDKDASGRLESRKALLLSTALSFTHDNSLWGPSGPLDGSRFNVTLAFTSDVQYANVNYASVIVDYRHYLRLGLRTAFASRAWLFHNNGKESRRFVMGGSWDLRGYPRWSIRGEKLWLTSHELRFPFVDELAVRFPFVGLSFWSIRGALFADAGGAWDRRYRETLGSVGGGVRMNLFGILVLRYDLGKRIEGNFTRFQKGIFHQFFFGWDF